MPLNDKPLNLDKVAGERAQEIIKLAQQLGGKKIVESAEHLVTKSLGVLQEQGIYALMLFLFSRTGDESKVAPIIRTELYKALKQIPGLDSAEIDDEKALKFFTDKIVNDIDTLLLLRDLYEQTLIYARYGAKAAEKGG
jgi:hypothetical protein